MFSSGTSHRRCNALPKSELLAAFKQSLRDLEQAQALSPGDIEIDRLTRTLRSKIGELEKHHPENQNTAA
jgi:hypothetical protein